MQKGRDHPHDGVSEVTGTMLLIALVVILAAFVTASVFSLAGSSLATKNIGITVFPGYLNNTSQTALITVHGGLDLERMVYLEYTVDDGVTWRGISDREGNELVPGLDYPLTVGDVVATGADDPKGKRLLLRGTFTDGNMQVLYDRNF